MKLILNSPFGIDDMTKIKIDHAKETYDSVEGFKYVYS